MIRVVTCLCGGSESLIRNFLKSIGYNDWLNIPITKGKEKSLSVINQLPPTSEKEMLKNLLKNASKWAIIIGYNETSMKWSDISHNGPKSRIEAEALVNYYEHLTKTL